MAKNSSTTGDTPAAGQDPLTSQITQPEPQIPLGDFCRHMSLSDSRVELIGAFHAVEQTAGRVFDLESAYATRFVAFASAPA